VFYEIATNAVICESFAVLPVLLTFITKPTIQKVLQIYYSFLRLSLLFMRTYTPKHKASDAQPYPECKICCRRNLNTPYYKKNRRHISRILYADRSLHDCHLSWRTGRPAALYCLPPKRRTCARTTEPADPPYRGF
jgi:hypothetical protein